MSRLNSIGFMYDDDSTSDVLIARFELALDITAELDIQIYHRLFLLFISHICRC